MHQIALHSLFAFIYLLPGLCITRKFIVNNPCHGLQMQVEEEAFKEIRFYICGVFLDKLMGQDKKNNLFGFKKNRSNMFTPAL